MDRSSETITQEPGADRSTFVPPQNEPIRAEIFGLDHLDTHARWLAVSAQVGRRPSSGKSFLHRFREVGERLTVSYEKIVAASQQKEILPPAAEWFLDNFHIIVEALREVRTDLPRGYYDRLPKLLEGTHAGLPRVYALAVELIAHTDSSLDESNITRFVKTYQTQSPLQIGELWAVPIMLRVVLLENLSRLAGRILHTREERLNAELWVRRRMANPNEPEGTWSDPCVVQILQLLREQGMAPDIDWLEIYLGKSGTSCNEVLRREHQRQAVDQVSVSNSVTSLRLLSNLDWSKFFDRTSLVEMLLHDDPARVYSKQDFATKDRYRRRIEELSRGAELNELDVVRRLLRRGQEGHAARKSSASHVGYYLIGPGRQAFERELLYRPPFRERITQTVLRRPGEFYFGSLFLLTALGVFACASLAASLGASGWVVALAALASLLPVSDLAVSLLHFTITRLLPPRVLPKLDFKDGLPEEFATFVVIPTMLTKPENVADLAERIEIHYLSNPDPQLRFALLTDFADSPTETRPEDEALVQAMLEAVRDLNRRYPSDRGDRFYLFHRRRQWNPSEGSWMGWERKRGKLGEFNRLLRGAQDTSYRVVSGTLSRLPLIRYVITLDTDTQMPRETARRLVATMAHPLNKAHYDPQRHRVVEGYGLIQPRVSLTILAGTRSRFSRVLASSAGIDPYTTAVSDVYQDLFGRGTFTGKGIYDIDAFEHAAGHAFPENRILSHDLIEGNFARCALATDVELIDDFPARYHAYAKREHRWVRGDWQIASWLLPSVPAPGGRRSNPLPALERWKILDNLRRSLVPTSLLVLLVAGWTVLPGSPWFWTALSLSVLASPLVLLMENAVTNFVLGRTKREEWHDLRLGMRSTAGQFLLSLAFLPYQAWNLLDAIARVFFRLLVSKRKLLEWETAASAESRLGTTLKHFYTGMWFAPLFALGVFAGLLSAESSVLLWTAAGPLLFLWFLSPAIAWWASKPLPLRHEDALTEEETSQLRRVARKTWLFFDRCVTAADHWLPPDNFQEHPKGVLAHRTSPTNMGLFLLSTLAAHDFGYLSRKQLVTRLRDTLDTFDQLERHHGHFYNWYETTTLQVLNPPYLSTVDSGNLLGCLVALRQGLLERAESQPDPAAIHDGAADTLRLLRESLKAIEPNDAALAFGEVEGVLASVTETLNDWPKVPGELRARLALLDERVQALGDRVARLMKSVGEEPDGVEMWAEELCKQVHAWREEIDSPTGPADFEALAARADAFSTAMDFKILYNEQRNLFSIGLNRHAGKLDQSHYDLLASEAALTSFLAVARGDVPKKHWFQLGRLITPAGNGIALVSWGGTMFEYLMPRLLMKTFPGTLLDESVRGAVARQIEYGMESQVPWGVSESGFNALDAGLDYQYQSFGVPGLGLKRGLSRDLVVAPYATGLATLVRPKAALANFQALTKEKAEGPFGYYEAIDYTQVRLGGKRRSAVVQSYMAHHQGMILNALANALLDQVMVRRFHADPMVRATDLLLQERLPRVAPLVEPHEEEENQSERVVREVVQPVSRRLTTADTPHPRTHLLSNGQYSVMLTNSGGGYSHFGELAVSRWREDRVRDDYGQFCFLRDEETGQLWSATRHPLGAPADSYEVIYATDKAEFRRRDGEIETHLEVTVSPEHSAEVRWLTLTNLGDEARVVECTSYLEVVLLPQKADVAHPAFGKLFLETEWLPQQAAILCRRRPRSAEQKPLWAVHVLAVEGDAAGPIEYETDRSRFLGRGGTLATADAMKPGTGLSGTTGPVLDPVLSLRRKVHVPSGGSVGVAFTTLVTSTREEAIALADRYHDFHAVHRAFELAWAHTRVQLQHLHLSDEDAHLYQRLASHLIYSGSLLRAPGPTIASNRQTQAGLWRHGISGDRPMLVASVTDSSELAMIRQLLLAHSYWRLQGLEVDLVLLNEHPTSYQGGMQEQLLELVRANSSQGLIDKPGGIFLRRGDTLSREDRSLLLAVARVVLRGDRGSLEAQLERREPPASLPPSKTSQPARAARFAPVPQFDAEFSNGYGGFVAEGREYAVAVRQENEKLRLCPAPWVNVVANEACGFTISESGSGYTWTVNSQANRLTPWANDPVGDSPSEVVYLRDEATGVFWSPTPLPCGGPTVVKHGFGSSSFQSSAEGIEATLTLFVPPEDSVKVVLLKLKNTTAERRRLTATFFAEWTLGTTRDATAMHVVTECDRDGPVLARNAFNLDFGDRVAFADVGARPRSFTADRLEFIGRNGTLSSPAALRRERLADRAGAGIDPCAAVQCAVELAPGEEREIPFVLGQTANTEEATRLATKYRDHQQARQALDAVRQQWERFVSMIQVRTPDREIDLLLNGWLAYQSLACRVWGRSALYQSGGAYGFRDQLQDVMALVHAVPQETRAQILRASGRQFPEGDVQHWWHPPMGQGVRTRFSDDFLWLPLAVSRYVTVTGDATVLDEQVAFLSGPKLTPEQEESYYQPSVSEDTASVFEHCLRALDNGLKFGSHGLPLMGIGDWNDGMNKVGNHGRGESVWNAWFQLTILPWFVSTCRQRGEMDRAIKYEAAIRSLKEAVEQNAWDGDWYRRAYFDDGTSLGSKDSPECQIDSLAQTWAVISAAGDPERARHAMEAVYQKLVRFDERLILLFTPPFDKSDLQPGYIKGYLPGIRENGGQYTHAAVWTVYAFALLGEGSRARELYRLLNPILASESEETANRYKVEPYVVAADVYGVPPHTGRGGWTWYTGSAGWMYRVGIEAILGFQREADRFKVDPCIDPKWDRFEMTYRHRDATYRIEVKNPKGIEKGLKSVTLDGTRLASPWIPLTDQGEHQVIVEMG